MTAREVSVDTVIDEIARHHDLRREAFVAFDGDGTLWSGDIGEDLFHHFVARQLVRDDALEPLDALAAEFGIHTSGSPTARAQRLFEAYVEGRLPERRACEMMVWVYAGWQVHSLSEEAAHALEKAGLVGRMRRELERVVRELRRRSIRPLVVSASPAVAVEVAVKPWDFDPADVLAGRSAVGAGCVKGRMAEPLPYGPDKVAAARCRMGEAHWLASFGDNGFDFEMLDVAELGVAVWPKPALAVRLDELENAVVVRPGRSF